MNVLTATITGVSIFVAERNDLGLVCQTLVSEARPATFAAADTALAFASLGRTSAWELDANGGVEATVAAVDNRFNGTVAARLDQAVGTTHEPFEYDNACKLENGDLVSDGELTEIYVVGGSSTDGDVTKLHMVGEGKTWAERYTGQFIPQQLVMRARRKA